MWCNRCWVSRRACRHPTLQTDCNLLLEATSHLLWQTASKVNEKRLEYRAEVSSWLACTFPLPFQVISIRGQSQIMLLWPALTGWRTAVYYFLLTLRCRGVSSAQGNTGLSSVIVRLGMDSATLSASFFSSIIQIREENLLSLWLCRSNWFFHTIIFHLVQNVCFNQDIKDCFFISMPSEIPWEHFAYILFNSAETGTYEVPKRVLFFAFLLH